MSNPVPIHLIFETKEQADAALDAIAAQARNLYAAAGYTVNPDGSVKGRKPFGVVAGEGVTTRLANAHQTSSGSWAFQSPRVFYPEHADYLIATIVDPYVEARPSFPEEPSAYE